MIETEEKNGTSENQCTLEVIAVQCVHCFCLEIWVWWLNQKTRFKSYIIEHDISFNAWRRQLKTDTRTQHSRLWFTQIRSGFLYTHLSKDFHQAPPILHCHVYRWINVRITTVHFDTMRMPFLVWYEIECKAYSVVILGQGDLRFEQKQLTL